METAKVDIRKLQTLNDCINRTIEALNQVRLSVHGAGLSHSALGVQNYGAPGYLGFQTPFASPFASPFGVGPQVAPQIAAQMFGIQPNVNGIGHTAATGVNPFAATGLNPFAATGLNPFAATTMNPFAATTMNPFNGFNPYWTQTGLGHTANVQQEYVDPYVSTRIAQTFPFVSWGYSPFNWPTV